MLNNWYLKDIKFEVKNGVFKIINNFWGKMKVLIKGKLKINDQTNQNRLKNWGKVFYQ